MVTKTLKEKLDELNVVLKSYEEKLYLNKITLREVDIDVGLSQIKSMHHEDIWEMILQWEYYAMGLQKEINYHRTLVLWLESLLKKATDGEYIDRLNETRCDKLMKIETLSYLPGKITCLCKFASEIANSKKWSGKNAKRTD